MKIVIAGGSGFLGNFLKLKFKHLNHDVIVITRQKTNMWSPVNLKEIINGADVLINLSGRNINCTHNKKNKEQILNSRIKSTQLLLQAIRGCNEPPSLWINASASAIYKANEFEPSTEKSTEFSDGFLANVVREWEQEFFKSDLLYTRRVALRTSVVLANNSGAYPVLRKLTKFGLGGKIGDGKQIFSWIHLEDYFRVVHFIVSNVDIIGVVNCSAPFPISNNLLMKSFRKAVSIPFGLPAPEFAVKIGVKLIGTDADLVLKSSNVYPQALLDKGFVFNFETINEVLVDLEN